MKAPTPGFKKKKTPKWEKNKIAFATPQHLNHTLKTEKEHNWDSTNG